MKELWCFIYLNDHTHPLHRDAACILTNIFDYTTDATPNGVQMTQTRVSLVEDGLQLRLTLIEATGFAESLDNTNWYVDAFVLSVVNGVGTSRIGSTRSCGGV